MLQFVKLAISTLLIVLPFPGYAQGLSHPSKYSNCKSLQSAYPFGIAKDEASAGLYKAKISASIYKRYKKLDFDSDGIVCEKEIMQSALTTSTTTTTTLVGMAGGSVAPAGTWEDSYLYDTKELLVGKGYRLYMCASGGVYGWSMLEVQINNQWTTKAMAVITTPSPLCGSTYPILHSYYWIVDVSGPEAKTLVNVRLQGFSNTNEKMRTVVKTPSQLTTSLPSTNTPIYTPPTPLISTTTTTTPMPTLSFSEERFRSGTCSLISANFDMSSSFQCPGLSSLKLYGQPQKNFSFPAIFKRQYQWNGTNVMCSWNIGSALYFCS